MSQNRENLNNLSKDLLVILESQAYKEIVLHSTRFCNPGISQSQWREVYGFLVGKLEDNSVVVSEAIPMVHGGSTEVEFEEKHYIEAAEVNEKAADKGFFLVGWYHSHPGLNIFLSSIDIKNHIGYQGLNPKAIALVIDPLKITTTYSGFEIFILDDPTNFNSSYHKLSWKITGLDEKFVGQMLIDLSHRATTQRPLVEEYGEAKPSSNNLIREEIRTELKDESPESVSVALEMLEKALTFSEKHDYEKAIDLAISAGRQFEEIGKIEFASDAFLQVGAILYDFWTKIHQIRTEIFTHQRDTTESDAEIMLRLAKALSSASKLISPEKIGLILEIRDLSGKMTKVEDDKIQVTNILLEAAEVYANLLKYAFKKKNKEEIMNFSKKAANILSTALIFARSIKRQRELLDQVINLNKIISEINLNLIRIQEIKAEESEGLTEYIKAANLYTGGAKKAIEAAQSLKDTVLANTLYGYAEVCLGKAYRSMGEQKRYIDRAPCIASAYYNLACLHFEKAQRQYPIHAMADIKVAEGLFDICHNQMNKMKEQCKKENKKIIDPETISEIEPEVIISEPEPLFYP